MHCECCIKWWWVNYLLHGRNCCATSLASRSLARVHLLTHLQTLHRGQGTLFCDLGKLSSSWDKLFCYKLSLQIASSRTLAHSCFQTLQCLKKHGRLLHSERNSILRDEATLKQISKSSTPHCFVCEHLSLISVMLSTMDKMIA